MSHKTFTGKRKISGAIHSTKIFGYFGLKVNGSARSKRKSFEKAGQPFEMNHFFRLDRSDRNWPFHSTFSTHFQSQYLTVRYVSSVLLVHTCVVTTITKLCYAVYVLAVKNGLFPERLSNILSLFESGVWRSFNSTAKNRQSAQNNPLYGLNFYAWNNSHNIIDKVEFVI